jgi:hypothetical protein
MVEVVQTVTTTTTKTKYWGLSKKTSTDSETFKTAVEIPYLTGLICGYDVMSLESGGISTVLPKDSSILALIGLGATALGVGMMATWGFMLGPAGIAVAGTIALLYSFFKGSKNTETTVSPQTISRQWTKIKDDKARFAIGIRDINIYSYTFAEMSEIVSKSYTIPAPISKVSLTVDEQIPKIFYSDSSRSSTRNDWIKYYVSVDNGTSWHRISPISHMSTMSEDGKNQVPEIISFNSDVPAAERDNPLAYVDSAEASYQIRFKAVLSRPTDITAAESYTPVLSRYALQIYPLGGL